MIAAFLVYAISCHTVRQLVDVSLLRGRERVVADHRSGYGRPSRHERE